jgi:hypothetical protein
MQGAFIKSTIGDFFRMPRGAVEAFLMNRLPAVQVCLLMTFFAFNYDFHFSPPHVIKIEEPID